MLFVVGRFFSKSTLLKISFRNTIRVSKSLDPDLARHFVGPDLDPNCLQNYPQTTLVSKQFNMNAQLPSGDKHLNFGLSLSGPQIRVCN